MKRLAMCILVAGAMACGGKKDKDKEAPPPPPPTQTAPADAAAGSAAPTPPPPEQAAVDVPSATDFEDQAAKDITDKNVEAKVKALETDLGQ